MRDRRVFGQRAECAAVAPFGERDDPPGAGGVHRQRRDRRRHALLSRSRLPVQARRAGIGGIGVSRLDASGAVYNMRNLQDINGVYGQARSGWAIGDQGRGRMWLQNANGVYLKLQARRQGLALSLGADGMVIELGS